jgi:hypothetical protein
VPAWWPGGRGGLERGLDGVGDKLRGLRVDGDVAAEQHAADDLPGVPGRILRVGEPSAYIYFRLQFVKDSDVADQQGFGKGSVIGIPVVMS